MSNDQTKPSEAVLHRALDVLDEDKRLATTLVEPLEHDRPGARSAVGTDDPISLESLVARCGAELVRLPRLRPLVLPGETLQALESSWPTVPDDILPEWHRGDVVAVFVAGLAGAFTSYALKEKFAALHDGQFSAQHAGETIDRVPGAGVGGFFHRLKHGHDLLNPFEVDWKRYAPQKGLVGVAASFWPWLRHLLQDTFSREGLPLPGNTALRSLILKTIEVDYDTYRSLLTVKMRDLVGAALTTAIIEGYVYGPALLSGRTERWTGYRHLSLAAGAHLVSLSTGLLLPTPSLNYGSAAAGIYFGVKLVAAIRGVDQILAQRDRALEARGDGLNKRDRAIEHGVLALDGQGAQIMAFGERLDAAITRARALTSAVVIPLPDPEDEQQIAGWLDRLGATPPEGSD